MANVSADFKVVAKGPLFSGKWAAEMRHAIQEAEQEVADEAVDRIQSHLDSVLRHPTGFYRSQIRARPHGEVVTVDDSNVIYGPWLEGVGSRNKTSRFKGYATFRRVSEEMKRIGPQIGESIIMKYVNR